MWVKTDWVVFSHIGPLSGPGIDAAELLDGIIVLIQTTLLVKPAVHIRFHRGTSESSPGFSMGSLTTLSNRLFDPKGRNHQYYRAF